MTLVRAKLLVELDLLRLISAVNVCLAAGLTRHSQTRRIRKCPLDLGITDGYYFLGFSTLYSLRPLEESTACLLLPLCHVHPRTPVFS